MTETQDQASGNLEPGDLSTSSSRITPETYLTAVRTHSTRLQETHLTPGANYQGLANFLGVGLEPTSLSIRRQFSPAADSFTYITAIQLHLSDETSNVLRDVLRYDDTKGTAEFTKSHPQLADYSAQIIFLHGYPSPSWVGALGSHFMLDAEFFRRHLRFLQPRNYFDLPSLPSKARNIIRIPFTTICQRQTALSSDDFKRERAEARKKVKSHHIKLNTSGNVGDSIIRRYGVYNENIFTIDQEISCIICARKEGGWFAIAWLDCGKELQRCPGAPWASPNQETTKSSPQPFVFPVFQHEQNASLRHSEAKGDVTKAASGRLQTLTQIPSDYGKNLDSAIMLADASYALSSLYSFAAASNNQFMNFIRSHIEEALHSSDAQQELSLTNLRYFRSILDDHIMDLAAIVEQLEKHKHSSWSKVTSPGKSKDESRDLQSKDWIIRETLEENLADYRALYRTAKDLSKLCIHGAGSILDRGMLGESRRAIEQAEKLKRLTILAFFFVPLSFLASIFGMNFKQFGQGQLSLWIYFVLALPALWLSAMILFWEKIRKNLFSKQEVQ